MLISFDWHPTEIYMRIVGLGGPENVKTSGDYRESYVYRTFFHGDLPPQGQNRYGERPYKPLKIRRNTMFNPVVTFPSIMMIIASELAEQLSPLPHIDYHAVELDAVYEYPTDEAPVRSVLSQCSALDESFDDWQQARARQPTPAERAAFSRVEVIAPSVALIRHRYTDVTNVTPVHRTPSCRALRVVTSPQIHHEYSMIKCEGVYWMREDLFARLREHVSGAHLYGIYEFEI